MLPVLLVAGSLGHSRSQSASSSVNGLKVLGRRRNHPAGKMLIFKVRLNDTQSRCSKLDLFILLPEFGHRNEISWRKHYFISFLLKSTNLIRWESRVNPLLQMFLVPPSVPPVQGKKKSAHFAEQHVTSAPRSTEKRFFYGH